MLGALNYTQCNCKTWMPWIVISCHYLPVSGLGNLPPLLMLPLRNRTQLFLLIPIPRHACPALLFPVATSLCQDWVTCAIALHMTSNPVSTFTTCARFSGSLSQEYNPNVRASSPERRVCETTNPNSQSASGLSEGGPPPADKDK